MKNSHIVMTNDLFLFSRKRIFDSNAITVISGLFIIMYNDYGLHVDVLKKNQETTIKNAFVS